jgi:hypothetical protein
MIKLNAHVSKKVPIASQDYSSQQFSAGIEVEVADGAHPDALRRRLADLHGMLSAAVDAQISDAAQNAPAPSGNSHGNGGNGNCRHNDNGRRLPPASDAQLRAIARICERIGVDPQQYLARDLSIREASRIIDGLKSNRAAS